jgi:TPR repeat protein
MMGKYYQGGGGGLCKRDQQQAFYYFKKAADNGNAEAQAITAAYYLVPQNVITKDEVKAFKYAKKGALQGYATAQCILGMLYTEGIGVPKNEILGYAWTDQAAKQGNPQAIKTKNSMLACPTFRKNSLAQGEALSVALEKRLPKEKKS